MVARGDARGRGGPATTQVTIKLGKPRGRNNIVFKDWTERVLAESKRAERLDVFQHVPGK